MMSHREFITFKLQEHSRDVLKERIRERRIAHDEVRQAEANITGRLPYHTDVMPLLYEAIMVYMNDATHTVNGLKTYFASSPIPCYIDAILKLNFTLPVELLNLTTEETIEKVESLLWDIFNILMTKNYCYEGFLGGESYFIKSHFSSSWYDILFARYIREQISRPMEPCESSKKTSPKSKKGIKK